VRCLATLARKKSSHPLDFVGGSRSHLRSLAPLSGRGPAHDEPELPDATGRPVTPCRARAAEHGRPTDARRFRRAEMLVRRFFGRVCPLSARFPLFFYGSACQRRSMRDHRQVHRCHQHTAARRCRTHRSGGPGRQQRDPRRPRFRARQKQGISRIAPPPISEPRGRKWPVRARV